MKRKIYIIMYFIIMGIIIFTSNDISVFKTELEYVACGNAGGIPKVIPQLTSTLYSILMFAVPIALIIFGVITLIKAIISTNADEIAKARGKLAKKFMMAAIAFAVIFITSTIFNMLANGRDANDKPSISQCMSCFLSYSDNHCYKSDSGNDVHKGSSYEPYSGEKIETHPETSVSSGTGLAALFAAAKKADQLTYSRGYSYGHSSAWNGTDYPNKLVACDRGVGLTLYFFGYTEVNPAELTLAGLEKYLPQWGWEKITNYDAIQPGDIVFYDRAHNGYMESNDHVFLVGETIGQRYDWGSDNRIKHLSQYSGGMPFTEGISRAEFGWAYRMPASKRNEKVDGISSSSSSGAISTGRALSKSEAESSFNSMSVPTEEEIKSAARSTLGMSDKDAERMVALAANEGYYLDPYFAYLCACTIVNQYKANKTKIDAGQLNLISVWGGADHSYGDHILNKNFDEARLNGAKKSVLLAIKNLNTKAYFCDGVSNYEPFGGKVIYQSTVYTNYPFRVWTSPWNR